MAKKKQEEIEENYREFGFFTKDDDGVVLVAHSNHGNDKKKYLEYAKKMKRPILLQVESDIFSSYSFTNFAMTIDEAKSLVKELSMMIEHLEESE